MENRQKAAHAVRAIAHDGLATIVVASFSIGLALITVGRRIDASFDVWRPRSETGMRTIHPRNPELRVVVRGLVTFGEAVAGEILTAFWKPRLQ